jgi:FtsP/CotA-like multicopper oxidase with cupredoxin domain
MMRLTRRDMLKLGIAVGGAAIIPGRRLLADGGGGSEELPPSPATIPFIVELLPGRGIPRIAQPVAPFPTLPDPRNCVNVDGTTAFHVHGPRVVPPNTNFFVVHERPVAHSFSPQLPDNILWGYDGSIPGPTFVSPNGTPFLVRFVNDLPLNDPVGIGEPITAIHRHGGFQAPEDDGYPLDTFCTGQSRDYLLPSRPEGELVQNLHSTNWYHDHAIDITGPNVYRGLAGFYLYTNFLDTGNELDPPPALGLPSGEFDIGLVVQDRQFNKNGFLVFDTFDHNGFLGDKFLVNGIIQPFLKVARRKYRFRFLNGSNARFYELSLSNGQPFVAIATDSNLLEHPVTVKSFRIGPAERVEVVVDFKAASLGDEIFLVNRLEQTDGRKPGDLVSPGTPILKFVVNRDAADPSRVPATLLPVTQGPAQLLPQVKVQRRFKFERSDGAWVINGEFFDENRINATPKLGEPEIWTFESGGGWVHPVHTHLSEFFVLSRDGEAPPPLERGRKETINVGATTSQEVSILIRFQEFVGRYVFHCHNIEHEDMRMMGQFETQP